MNYIPEVCNGDFLIIETKDIKITFIGKYLDRNNDTIYCHISYDPRYGVRYNDILSITDVLNTNIRLASSDEINEMMSVVCSNK